MRNYISYEDTEKNDKICPLLSIGEAGRYDTMLRCVGERCMWWEKCKPITEIPNILEWSE